MLTCSPPSTRLRPASGDTPSKEEILDQMKLAQPYVFECAHERTARSALIVMLELSGRTGTVSRLALIATDGPKSSEIDVEPAVAECIARVFSGVCVVPFGKEKLAIRFPYKLGSAPKPGH